MLSRAIQLSKLTLKPALQTNLCHAAQVSLMRRQFSAMPAVQQEQNTEVETGDARNARLGVDVQFDKQKHAYVLTFPWNFPEIIDQYEANISPLADNNYWSVFVRNSGAEYDFNNLFREFHQYCALPDAEGIEKICEAKLATAVNQSVQRIHFHGLDVEMANLTVHQPKIQVLKCEIAHGLAVDRASNGQESDWTKSSSSIMGAPCDYYTPAQSDDRHVLDNLQVGNKPYCIAVTALIESPMKLFVQNQNYSKILFGSDDQECVKNVVRFEANVYWTDLLKVLPVNNKPSLKWKITDFNNLMNENAHFQM